jgi:hypothetical protein
MNMETGKTIGNVNLLDIRKATNETIAGIRQIGNVNVLLFSPETAHLVTSLNIGNINASIEVPSDTKTHTSIGRQVLNKDFLSQVSEPLFIVSVGQMLVEPDLPQAVFEQKIVGLAVVGQIVCPENFLGLFQSKARQVIGESVAYPLMGKTVLNSLTLDPVTLQTMADDTQLAVVGSLTAPAVLDNELVERKISRLFVSGTVTIHEENIAAFQSTFTRGDQKVTLIPPGFSLVEKDLVINTYIVDILPTKKLYCTRSVLIDAGVSASQLDESIDSLIVKDKIMCPAGLRSTLKTKCNLLETNVVFYDGILWQVENERAITQAQLKAVKEKVTILVEGDLTFSEDVTIELLDEKLARIDVFGIVRCTPEQMGVIETKVGAREGLLQDSTLPLGEETGEESQIGNANTLTL